MRRILTREEWRRKRQRNRMMAILIVILLSLVILILTILITYTALHHDKISDQGIISDLKDNLLGNNREGITAIEDTLSNSVVIQSDYLTPNEYSRPQTPLKDINSIVVHYTANPGTSAQNNRSYFEGLAKKHTTYASSHYIIGLEGEVLQCIPLNEISYASNDRNKDTVAIECCIEDDTGRFSEATYSSLVSLTAALCLEFHLGEEEMIRHYDITGKICPKYYVEHEDEWFQFRRDVLAEMEHIKTLENNE